ncbi:pentatricopeptide repeat-containing protein At4g26680, mitochondrial-like [Diospyros lotus]|uniref:pentatricopeptide repeat-containing protein At4g26680, mitochondrial-like n=1 Tax=Diospyros lotus TaxID=55363 RepID=UPI00224DB870|nr:pentatricopeptide repeat-containing protein At4g26680, mitochondrial-like [Diospyros lotus]XP_052194540.1 pentatricopeptide repeat-containing protein At4g26680, mitochondrial-like [Diospyros lotus]
MNYHRVFRRFSTLIDSPKKDTIPRKLKDRNRNPIPLPHRTVIEPRGQDLDYVTVAHSHLIHSDWPKLGKLVPGLSPFRVQHILLKVQKDYVLSLEFFDWVQLQKPKFHTLETYSIILHILTKNRKFKSAESILRNILKSDEIDIPSKLFEAILNSYRVCDSSPRVFDTLFKTCAHMKKFRNATDTFCWMKEYGFHPTVESCNAFFSSLISLNRADIAVAFYKEMQRSWISPNIYTLNMFIGALCKLGKLEKAVEVFGKMEGMGCAPTVVSYNSLIAGHCNLDLLNTAMKLKNLMQKSGLSPNDVTFNTLIHGFCKEGKLHEATKLFNEMKGMNVSPNTITYNTLINGYSQVGNIEMGRWLCEEMSRKGIRADILTYNALIFGLCKEGKTKKAAYLVKELDSKKLTPNSSTFSALIVGQCVKKNSEHAFQLYKSMVKCGCQPNEQTFNMLLSTFCKNEDFDGGGQVLLDMLERSMIPDLTMLSELCHGLSQCGKDKLVARLCKEMEARHLLPEGFEKTNSSIT